MSTISTQVAVLALAAVLSGGAYAATEPDDTQINAEVQKHINERPSLRFYNLSVRTTGHVVTLEGLVDTNVDRSQAEAIARAVPGVARVNDKLALNGNGWPSTRALNSQAQTRDVDSQVSARDD